jgi:two-component system phosphate regulon sensor histidine kinase PhoR
MNPRLLFWVPTGLRLAFLLTGVGVVAFFFGWVAALLTTLACLCLVLGIQLHALYRLSLWLDDPGGARLPDGWGAWNGIFARLYKLHREGQKNQTELAEWLARFRQAMHLLPDGVAIINDVLFLEWCNPAAERHLGLELDRDQGRRITNLVRHPAFIDYLILGRYEQPLSITLRDRRFSMQIIPFENRRQILVTHDETEAERIDMMRRDFIANASHELRTPLTVINGFLEIAAGQPQLDPQTRAAHVQLMVEQGRRMQNLVEDMLTLTRLESIEHPLRPERVAIRPLLEQMLRETQALSAGRHTVTLEVDGPDIRGSAEELHSAFANLASNAVRYTPEGGSIRMAWRATEAGPQFLVQDSGIGIAPEHLSRLTERFYRIDKARSRATQGTGLGLAIVKHVLLRHDGTLAIESELGKGSTFTAQFSPRVVWAD